LPLRNTAASWTCTGSGGAAPYTYRWYRNGQLVSQTSSYATTVDTADFGLRAEATDANGVVGYLDMLVDVDGIRGTISGPNIVYYSQGGGTWTASGRGGANSYVFDWYTWDDMSTTWQWVGSGSSWTGYPGEGNTEVLLKTTNGTPEHNDIARPVTGIGNESCAPVPPAVTCEG
jgi:hypothetical protein